MAIHIAWPYQIADHQMGLHISFLKIIDVQTFLQSFYLIITGSYM